MGQFEELRQAESGLLRQCFTTVQLVQFESFGSETYTTMNTAM